MFTSDLALGAEAEMSKKKKGRKFCFGDGHLRMKAELRNQGFAKLEVELL